MTANHVIVHTDGGSRGNPGPASAAYVLHDTDGRLIRGKGVFLSETTNNVAEYTALLLALKAAERLGAGRIELFSDSELMVRQINGQYRVKSKNLKGIFAECMAVLAGFRHWRLNHISRDENAQADELANRAMDMKAEVTMGSARAKGCPATKPIRLGVMISGGGTTMVNIDREIKAGRLNARIVAVISSRSDVKGLERARHMGLEPVIIRRKDFPDIEQFSRQIARTLDEAKVDLVVQAGWLCLWQIPPQYENRVMNIHPALLPSFGGRGMWGHHVHEAVLGAGCKVSGCTVHFANNQYDSGPIILQRSCRVEDADDAETLAARIFEQECIAYPQAIELFAQRRLEVVDGIVKIKDAP